MTLLEPPAPDEEVDDLLERYRVELASALSEVGHERAISETDLSAAEVDAIEVGDHEVVAAITLADAVELLGLVGRDPQDLQTAVRDELLLAMTTAVMDVDRLAATLEADLDPTEIQAKVEGRHPMTLGEYAALRAALAA